MNVRRHRLVFSPRLGMLVPREETGAARVKAAGGQSRRPGGPVRRCLVRAALVLLPTIAGMTQVHANPTAATVVSGSASFNTAGTTLTVTNSPNAIINWGSFSIGQNELTRFVQQSSASSVLNRVTGQDPSQILGQLQSNGRVYLVNPNGILFGQGARIDVAGLIASSLDISDADYLAGRFKFVGNGSEGLVSNAGEITTPTGGQVVLIAPNVENSGVISSPSGEILLAAGHTVDLVDSANPALRVEITASDGQAINLGTLIAEGGRLGVYAGLITQAGTVSASSAVAEGGRIYLKGTQAVTLADTGVIEANGTRGGEIITKVEANGQLSGRIDVQGTLTARGDGSPDSGGFIETSAAEVKIGTVRVNTGGGEWLIDPVDFTIAASGGDMTGSQLSSNLAEGGVTIESPSGINVNDAVSWDSGHTLSLSAAGSIAINANITAGSGGLSLQASDGNIGIAAGATVRIDALYAQAGGSFSNLGDLRIGNGAPGGNWISAASVNNAGTLQLDVGGWLSINAGANGNVRFVDSVPDIRVNALPQMDSPIENSGVIVNDGQIDFSSLFENTGVIVNSSLFENTGVIVNNGQLGGSPFFQRMLVLGSGGVYRGTGELEGDLLNTAGTVAPGASPGTVTITGNYTQGPSGTLLVEIGGATPGQQYDVLDVGGTATLAGTLAIQHYGGYLPAAGASFPGVVTAGAVSGAFSTLTAPAGFVYGVGYGQTQVDLEVLTALSSTLPSSVQRVVALGVASLVLAAPSFQTPQLSASGQTTDTAASGHQFSSPNLWPGQLPGGAPGADAGPGGQGTGFAQSLAAALAQGTSLAAAQAQAQAQAQTPAAALAQGGNSAEAVARASEPRASLDPAPHPAPSSTGLDTLASALAQGQSLAAAQAQTPAAALAQGGNSAEAVARASEPRASLETVVQPVARHRTSPGVDP